MSSQAPPKPQNAPNETYDWQEARERLNKAIETEHPESFIFDDDTPEFVGIFRRLKRAPSKFGMTPVAIFEEPVSGALRSIWLHHTVLRNRLVELAPVVGETVMIRYLGREEGKGEGAPEYANYAVAVDRPNDPGISWEGILNAPTEDRLPPELGEDAALMPGAADDDIPF